LFKVVFEYLYSNMKNISFFSICIAITCCVAVSYAQNDFAQIDQHADNAPVRLKHSIPALVKYLIRPAKSDLKKVRVIFRWITQNINYDVDAYFDRRLIVDDPQRVIRRGSAVCGGYSELFNRMCSEANIQSELIGGWSKGYGERLTGRPNHAWNAVKINFKWYLLDATWGAGHLNEQLKFTRRFNDHYFLTDPEQLIYDHLPEDEQWQLIKQPFTRKQFDNLVLLRPAFFANGLKLKSHFNSKITSDGKLTVKIEAPQNSYLSAQLLENNSPLSKNYSFTQRHDATYFVQMRFPKKGTYTLRLFVKEGREKTEYNWACDYEVTVTNSLGKKGFFVKQYGTFFDLNGFVHQPMNYLLKAGRVEKFKIELQDVLEVAIVSGESLFPLKKTANIFEGDVIVPKGLFHLAVKTDSSNYYHWLLEYEGK
jgi:hypothetical protein